MAPNVRVLAVSFLDEKSASAAADLVASTFEHSGALQLAPLGKPFYPTPERSILVGHFHNDVVAAVRAAVLGVGGTIELDIPEDRATR